VIDRRALREEAIRLQIGLASLGADGFATRLGIAGHKNGDMVRQAGGVLVVCPSHGDRTPSLSITRGPDRLLRVRCFGCDLSGDAFTLIAAVHGLDVRSGFAAVLEHARAITGTAAPFSAPRERAPEPRDETPPALDDESFDRVARWLLDKCPLVNDAEGAKYMAQRGLLEMAKGRLGCLPPLPYQPALILALCAELGEHLWKRSGLAHPNVTTRFAWGDNRLLIPWRAAGVDGLIVNVQRRALHARPSKGPKYAAPRFRTFPAPYGIEDASEELGEGVALVVVEGALDTLAARAMFRAEGIDAAVVGIPGVQGWRPAWAKLGRGREVKIGLDPDEAGNGAAATLAADFYAAGATRVSRIKTNAHDWAEGLAS
jgi:DNA primase